MFRRFSRLLKAVTRNQNAQADLATRVQKTLAGYVEIGLKTLRGMEPCQGHEQPGAGDTPPDPGADGAAAEPGDPDAQPGPGDFVIASLPVEIALVNAAQAGDWARVANIARESSGKPDLGIDFRRPIGFVELRTMLAPFRVPDAAIAAIAQANVTALARAVIEAAPLLAMEHGLVMNTDAAHALASDPIDWAAFHTAKDAFEAAEAGERGTTQEPDIAHIGQ